MHDVEPYHKWRDRYIASEDKQSPFYGRVYSEFQFSQKIYNYFIHPQWDSIGSSTLYAKVLFVDYQKGYCCIELLGEWNDCITNDIMFLKRELVDYLTHCDIHRYVVFCDNVLNFHGSDDSYYEEWYDDVKDDEGWICLINTRDHILSDMESMRLQNYVHLGERYNEFNWRALRPSQVLNHIEHLMSSRTKQLNY